MTDAVNSAAAPAAAAPDRTGWEDPPRAARSDTAPVLSVDGITGPLDWLLDMARAKKLSTAPSPGRPLLCRAAVASTQVAGLELACDGALTLGRAPTWAPIRVRPPTRGAAVPMAAAAQAEPAAAPAGP